MCVKFVYLVVYGMLFWLLYSLPSPMLWNKDGTVAAEYMTLLLFSVLVSYTALVCVQGSNPGYIEITGACDARCSLGRVATVTAAPPLLQSTRLSR